MDFEHFKKKYKKKEILEYSNNVVDNPMVSICVQTYQHRNYIKKCLEGILMQETNFPFEILLGEDNSTDGTRELCIDYQNKYPERIKLFLHQRENNIKINGRSTGRFNFVYNLFSAKGKYIAICEGDDYWTDPLKLQKQVDFLEKDQEYVLCFHKVKILEKSGEIVKDYLTSVPESYQSMEDLAREGNYIHTPSVLFKNIITSYPFQFIYAPFGDYFLYLLLAEKGKIKELKEIMAIYRRNVGIISKMDELDIIINNIQNFSSMISFFKNEIIFKTLVNRQSEIIRNFHGEKKRREIALPAKMEALEEFHTSDFEKRFLKNLRFFKRHFSWLKKSKN